MSPRCPACGAKVKLPKNVPLPPPHTKMKCPGCGSVGDLEAFLAAAGEDDVVEEAQPAPAPVPPRPSSAETGTRISGSATALNLPPGLRCTLTVISGPDSGRKLEITKPRIVVGRNSGDFPLTDEEISSQHCAFEISGVTCTVKDLDSRNGTWVDGQRITRQILSAVSEVVVGNSTLLFAMTLDEGVSAA